MPRHRLRASRLPCGALLAGAALPRRRRCRTAGAALRRALGRLRLSSRSAPARSSRCVLQRFDAGLVVLGKLAVPPGDLFLEPAHDLLHVRTAVGARALRGDAHEALVFGAQLGRRDDLVARVVGNGVKDDEGGLPRDEPERPAQAPDLRAVQLALGLELVDAQARPERRGQRAPGPLGAHREFE